jgi:hypothetical protein
MHASNTGFTVLLHLAEQIAKKNAPKSLCILIWSLHNGVCRS